MDQSTVKGQLELKVTDLLFIKTHFCTEILLLLEVVALVLSDWKDDLTTGRSAVFL